MQQGGLPYGAEGQGAPGLAVRLGGVFPVAVGGGIPAPRAPLCWAVWTSGSGWVEVACPGWAELVSVAALRMLQTTALRITACRGAVCVVNQKNNMQVMC